MTAGFKRIWQMPNRVLRGATLRGLSPQGRYLREHSRLRFARRDDAYLPGPLPLNGELGIIEGFRFIAAPYLE